MAESLGALSRAVVVNLDCEIHNGAPCTTCLEEARRDAKELAGRLWGRQP